MVNSSENFGESKLWVEVTNSFSRAVLMCFPPFLAFKMSKKLDVTEYFKTRWKLQCEAEDHIFCWHEPAIIPTDFGSENQEMPKLGWMGHHVSIFAI